MLFGVKLLLNGVLNKICIILGQYESNGYVARNKAVTIIPFPKYQILDRTKAVSIVTWKAISLSLHQAKLRYIFTTVISHWALTITTKILVASRFRLVTACITFGEHVANKNNKCKASMVHRWTSTPKVHLRI